MNRSHQVQLNDTKIDNQKSLFFLLLFGCSFFWIFFGFLCRFKKIQLTPSKIHWDVPGWYECSTQNKPCKQVCARTYVSCACMAHGLRCLHVRGACCPSLLKQLVILVVLEGIDRHRNLLLQLGVHWNVLGWYECSTENKPCKQERARTCVS